MTRHCSICDSTSHDRRLCRCRRRGGGILGRLSTFVSRGKRKGATKRFEGFVAKNKDRRIVNMEVQRERVKPVYVKALDALSRGRFSKKQKELGYEDMLHDSMVVTLDDGKRYRLEKNHVVEAQPLLPPLPQLRLGLARRDVVDSTNVPLPGDFTLGEAVSTASAGDSEFYNYDASGNNCQAFVDDVVTRNKLLPPGTIPRQDAKALVGSLGPLQGLPKLLTDVAAVGDRVLHGGGQFYSGDQDMQRRYRRQLLGRGLTPAQREAYRLSMLNEYEEAYREHPLADGARWQDYK